MTIYASCRHVVEDFDSLYSVSVKEYTSCGAQCISDKSVCLSCYNWYKEQDMLLYSDKDEALWLKSGKPCCGMC